MLCAPFYIYLSNETGNENSVNILLSSRVVPQWLTGHPRSAVMLASVIVVVVSVWISETLAANRTQLAVARITERLGTMVDMAVQSNEAVSTWLPSLRTVPCSMVAARLREGVATRPYLRSLTVWEKGQYRCSSVYGDIEGRVEGDLPRRGHAARLLTANQLTPDSGVLLILTATSPSQGVISGISANHLAEALHQPGVSDAWLAVDDARLRTQGGRAVITAPQPARTCEQRYTDRHRLVTLVVADGCETSMLTRWWDSGVALGSIGIVALLLGGLWRRLTVRQGRLHRELIVALRQGDIAPHYQPIFTLEDRCIVGAEVLVRWTHPTRGPISPDIFVPLLEVRGETLALTRYVLGRAAQDLLRAPWPLPADFYLSVNISPHELLDRGLIDAVRAFRRALPACGLALEITEREPLTWSPRLRAHVMLLSCLGARLLLDDFGTGYAGLSYLTMLRIDCVKIDKSFVQLADEPDRTHRRILEVIVDLCRSLSMSVIAEGVETACQRAYLREHGIKYGQGYWMAPPLNAAEFGRLLREQAP